MKQEKFSLGHFLVWSAGFKISQVSQLDDLATGFVVVVATTPPIAFIPYRQVAKIIVREDWYPIRVGSIDHITCFMLFNNALR